MSFDKVLRDKAIRLRKELDTREQSLREVLADLNRSCSHDLVVGNENWSSGAPVRICVFCGLEDRCIGGWSLYDVLKNSEQREIRKVEYHELWGFRKLKSLVETVTYVL